MNYYPFHMGDYSVHTGHLDLLEDLAYRRCLDFYYLHESPLPKDVTKLAKLIRMPDHAAVVRDILNEFFIQEDDCWRHLRCDEELAKMKEKRVKAQASAQASVNARRTNAQRTLNERSAKVELPIPIPTPIPKDKKEAQPAVDLPDWLDKETWTALVDMRKRIKKPMTDHAQKLMLGKLYRMKEAGHDIKAIMEKTIVNSWLDVYEPKVVQQVSRNSYESLL